MPPRAKGNGQRWSAFTEAEVDVESTGTTGAVGGDVRDRSDDKQNLSGGQLRRPARAAIALAIANDMPPRAAARRSSTRAAART